MTAEEAYEMMQCAKENGVLLMYGFMFRFSKSTMSDATSSNPACSAIFC